MFSGCQHDDPSHVGFYALVFLSSFLQIPQVNRSLVPRPLTDLFHSHREKLGQGLGSLLRHRPEMVDSVSMWTRFVLTIAMIPGLLLIFLHGYEIESGSGLGTRLSELYIQLYSGIQA